MDFENGLPDEATNITGELKSVSVSTEEYKSEKENQLNSVSVGVTEILETEEKKTLSSVSIASTKGGLTFVSFL